MINTDTLVSKLEEQFEDLGTDGRIWYDNIKIPLTVTAVYYF